MAVKACSLVGRRTRSITGTGLFPVSCHLPGNLK
nr:MAG TPA: hypothetical protein [Caudoviricetes sp.]